MARKKTAKSNIQTLLENRHNEKIDYEKLISNYPWIVEKNRVCVLSPDSDGLLCGLFMSHYRGWKIVGFYDDKVAVINKDNLKDDIVFLDGEIFRKEIKSFGHHMLTLNKTKIPDNYYENFKSCIQPNLLREYDGKHDFRLKYPLATIHMLVSIISYVDKSITIPKSAVSSLLFTDGVFQNLFSYPENVLNWLSYLRINEDWNPLKTVFINDDYSVFGLMTLMDDFFKKRDEINVKKERGDRLKISTKTGDFYNVFRDPKSNTAYINILAVHRIEKFLQLLQETTGWEYLCDDWVCFKNLKPYKFSKSNFSSNKKSLTINNFKEFIEKIPLSWAMTRGSEIEFTIESPSFLEINREIEEYCEDVLGIIPLKN